MDKDEKEMYELICSHRFDTAEEIKFKVTTAGNAVTGTFYLTYLAFWMMRKMN